MVSIFCDRVQLYFFRW